MGFGILRVSGPRRVPSPPARITACTLPPRASIARRGWWDPGGTPAGSWWLCDLRLERTGKPVRLAPVLCIMRSPTGVALIAVTLSTLSGADQPAPRWIALNRAARQALEAKDYSKLRDTLAELRPLMPGNPRLLYNLAASDSHLGQMERALAELKDLANAGLIYDFNADDDFASLRGSAGFASVLRQVEQNRKPTT